MSNILPNGKSPAQAAHDLVLALASSGHFSKTDSAAEMAKLLVHYEMLITKRYEIAFKLELKSSNALDDENSSTDGWN